ncbi:unnamed protein product, partial [marine sediment metagenome]
WNKIWKPFLHTTSWDKYKKVDRENLGKVMRILVELPYPPITLHLFAWQVYVLRWTPFKPILKAIIRLMSPKWNLLIKLLTYGKVTLKMIDSVPNYSSFIWQRCKVIGG